MGKPKTNKNCAVEDAEAETSSHREVRSNTQLNNSNEIFELILLPLVVCNRLSSRS